MSIKITEMSHSPDGTEVSYMRVRKLSEMRIYLFFSTDKLLYSVQFSCHSEMRI